MYLLTQSISPLIDLHLNDHQATIYSMPNSLLLFSRNICHVVYPSSELNPYLDCFRSVHMKHPSKLREDLFTAHFSEVSHLSECTEFGLCVKHFRLMSHASTEYSLNSTQDLMCLLLVYLPLLFCSLTPAHS